MQVSTKHFNAQSIERFSELNAAIQDSQAKIATGRKVLKASDDPIAAAAISAARDQKSMITQFESNVLQARMRLTIAETALSQLGTSVTRLFELSVQAQNDTLSPTDRTAIAAEVEQVKSFVLGLANTTDNSGQAVFGGFQTNTKPFQTQGDGSIDYKGDRGRHMLQVSESFSIKTGIDGAEVFQRIEGVSGPDDLFKIIGSLETGLKTNTISMDTTERLKKAVDHISIQQATIGSAINQADQQSEVLDRRKLAVSEDLSQLQDADLQQLVLEMQSLLLSRDAAQQAFAKIGQQSLFDFIR